MLHGRTCAPWLHWGLCCGTRQLQGGTQRDSSSARTQQAYQTQSCSCWIQSCSCCNMPCIGRPYAAIPPDRWQLLKCLLALFDQQSNARDGEAIHPVPSPQHSTLKKHVRGISPTIRVSTTLRVSSPTTAQSHVTHHHPFWASLPDACGHTH